MRHFSTSSGFAPMVLQDIAPTLYRHFACADRAMVLLFSCTESVIPEKAQLKQPPAQELRPQTFGKSAVSPIQCLQSLEKSAPQRISLERTQFSQQQGACFALGSQPSENKLERYPSARDGSLKLNMIIDDAHHCVPENGKLQSLESPRSLRNATLIGYNLKYRRYQACIRVYLLWIRVSLFFWTGQAKLYLAALAGVGRWRRFPSLSLSFLPFSSFFSIGEWSCLASQGRLTPFSYPF